MLWGEGALLWWLWWWLEDSSLDRGDGTLLWLWWLFCDRLRDDGGGHRERRRERLVERVSRGGVDGQRLRPS